MWTIEHRTDADGNINRLHLQFRFLNRHTGAGRFLRQSDGFFVLEICDRWGVYVCPLRYRLDEIDTWEKASAICTAAAERECGKDVEVEKRVRH
ncbi:hypothetical protein [Rhizobium leguminosarum]|uniref:hypothetical protein n=1 Tax=Rhizobium leguminosarum TaxID=384 RepID=UPI00103141EC|nr:hypothetical protein [Rhizobium leguminosarum]TAW50587.1 hypothetical protein ELI14_04005 [Rhizobium leguminosarum]